MTSQEPWLLQPIQFDTWYKREIEAGLDTFRVECGRAIDRVVRAMQQQAQMNIKEAVKAGSLGKGTMLKSASDFDCVVLVNPPSLPYLKDVQDTSPKGSYVGHDLARAHGKIKTAISHHADVVGTPYTTRLVLKVSIRVSGKIVDVDILPTADNLAVEGKSQLYASMMGRREGSDRLPYSASLVKLQVDFIKEKPGVVKELIRLVKYWNKFTVKAVLDKGGRSLLPTSYPMELITVYAWEKAGSPYAFDRLKGLKAVLNVIGNESGSLRHFWTDNYGASVAEKGIACMDNKDKHLPLILDPANPTNNVCANYHGTWSNVARVARDTLNSNLLRSIQVHGSW